MDIELYSGNGQGWDDYVRGSNEGVIYHLTGWKSVVENTFGHKPIYLVAKESQIIKGILPLFLMESKVFGRFIVSLPFLNYGGICADNKEARELLLKGAIIIAKQENAEHIELRHLENFDLGLPVKKTKVTMILELTSNSADLWNAFKAEIRNRIRKSQRCGLEVKIGGIEQLDNFYKVFSINMRDLGTPVYTKRFFENILKEFPNETRIFLVFFQDKVVASGLTVGFKNTFEMPWASSIRKYRDLAVNNLLYWEAIRYACENRYTQFDFGRSSWNSGTFEFKRRWGAQPKQLYWHYWLADGNEIPQLNSSNLKYALAIKIWKRLPVPITKLIGPRIVKYIP